MATRVRRWTSSPRNRFGRFAQTVSKFVSQGVCNTLTSVLAFLLIALLQNSERRYDEALHRKIERRRAAREGRGPARLDRTRAADVGPGRHPMSFAGLDGLVGKLRLMIFPVVIGEGKHLFDGIACPRAG